MNNASTGFDYTHYYIKSSSDNMEKSFTLYAELMQHLNLKDDEFQPERNVVAEERRWRTDNNPMGYLYFRLFNSAYIYHPYHWTPIGFMNDIQTWKLEDIQKFHATYYQPKNAILVVTGDIKPARVFKEAQKHFGAIPNTLDIPVVTTIEPEQDGARRVEVLKESEVEMIAISFPIPNFQHTDQPKLSSLSELLSSGKSSRLYKSLVDDKRLANMNVKAHIDGRGDMALVTHLCGQRLRRCAALMEKTTWIRPVDFPQISTREFDRAGHGQILNCNSAPA
jgi:predicted Zn-dependent peptidase